MRLLNELLSIYKVCISIKTVLQYIAYQLQMHVQGKSLVKVYKEVGYECLPDEYLPDDYEGPRIGSFSEITGKTTG